ncbi:hypothetical protein WMY93_008945 [Mugilogobius chulae]|uniref:Uncharacterized protein n=1 Tax=Mugilogobius chulae TaxID=88201 RepID=A0AAW0PDM4_9GOBI
MLIWRLCSSGACGALNQHTAGFDQSSPASSQLCTAGEDRAGSALDRNDMSEYVVLTVKDSHRGVCPGFFLFGIIVRCSALWSSPCLPVAVSSVLCPKSSTHKGRGQSDVSYCI